jgi:uncharacterized protein (TIGR02186 family)
MQPRMLSLGFCCAIVLPVVFSAPPARAGSPEPSEQRATIRVEPREIQVGMFYRGTNVHVDGTAPAGYRLALVCVGHEGRVELKRKGKVGGVLWMNVGDVTFDRVPSLYLVATDQDRADFHGRPVPAVVRLGLGYGGLEAQVLPGQGDENMHRLFREFIKLKEDERVYSVRNGPVRSSPTSVSTDFFWPASVPAGTYEVQLLGYQGDTGELLASETLTVKRVGLANLISSMAQRHGLIYGILSVLFAIAMGFFTGMIFRMASKGH